MSANENQGTGMSPYVDDGRLLSDESAEKVIDRIVTLCGKEDRLFVRVQSYWHGGTRWARNQAFMTSNEQQVFVSIFRYDGERSFSAVTLNQVDDASLHAACTYVEEDLARKRQNGYVSSLDLELSHPLLEAKGKPVWSDVSYNRTATENARAIADVTERAKKNGMQSAGFLVTTGARTLVCNRDPWGREQRKKGLATLAQCSTTVRHPKGVGSGWAGASSFDLQRIDIAKLGEIAFDKCLRSMNPVRIEPGRYQTILEPQAVASFTSILVDALGREGTEKPFSPFYLGYDSAIERHRGKLGLRIIDRRLTIAQDPEDPMFWTHPAAGMKKVELIKDGIFMAGFTGYKDYTLPELDTIPSDPTRKSFVMRGTETTTVDEMISTMKRGLLVTRFSGIEKLDEKSMLYTGLTRDGLWLIENGKITKAVRNFRWTESPAFVLNNVESIGESVPTLSDFNRYPFQRSLQNVVTSIVVPPLKVNDFSFTSTIDAV